MVHLSGTLRIAPASTQTIEGAEKEKKWNFIAKESLADVRLSKVTASEKGWEENIHSPACLLTFSSYNHLLYLQSASKEQTFTRFIYIYIVYIHNACRLRKNDAIA